MNTDRIESLAARSLEPQPVGLRRTAAAVAAGYGDKGAIVISFGAEGVRFGVANLSPQELREALCCAMHYSYLLEGTG